MASIKIVSIPPGQAPESVRKEWIGVVIPLLPEQEDDVIGCGVLDGVPSNENRGGYQVSARVAVDEVKKKAPEAGQWWEENLDGLDDMNFVFAKSVCELVV